MPDASAYKVLSSANVSTERPLTVNEKTGNSHSGSGFGFKSQLGLLNESILILWFMTRSYRRYLTGEVFGLCNFFFPNLQPVFFLYIFSLFCNFSRL